jgi:tRNA(fMet)-specific endonuclease VapC
MLDTDVCSHIIRGVRGRARRALAGLPRERLVISAVTRGELRYGCALRPKAHDLARAVDFFLSGIATLGWDEAAADCYGPLRASLRLREEPIGALDEMIGAHALSCGATLVTANVRHFSRVEGLSVRSWGLPG